MKRTLPYVLPFIPYLLSIFFDGLIVLLLGGVSLALLLAYWPKYKLHFKWSSRAFWTGVLVFLLWVGLEDLYHFTPQTVQLLYVIPVFLLVTPFVEELFFRHFLLKYRNTSKALPWARLAASGVLFVALLYPRWITGIVAALVYTWLYWKEKEVEPLILAHATANILILFYALFTSGTYLFY